MKTIVSFALLLTLTGVRAQNNLVVFSENGEKFFLIINGVKQNLEAETNVKVVDLIQPTYKAKIVFEDKAKGVVDQNIYLMQGGEPVKNHEFVFSVGMKKKGQYKARPVSAVAIGPQTKSDPEQTVVHYSTTEPTAAHNNVVNVADDGTALNNNSGTSTNVQTQTITKTQTQTNTNSNPNNSNVAVNMSINEGNLGMNGGGNISINGGVTTTSANNTNPNNSNAGVHMTINENNLGMNGGGNVSMNGGMTTTTSQTVTTTTTKSTGGTSVAKNTMSTANNTTKTRAQVDNGAVGGTGSGCTAMGAGDFNAAKASLKSQSFDDTKLKVAKQVLDNNCVTTAQVKEMMGLFSFEQSKLDLAKYAYGRTTDRNNFYQINDAFTFQSSITELDNHIKKSAK